MQLPGHSPNALRKLYTKLTSYYPPSHPSHQCLSPKARTEQLASSSRQVQRRSHVVGRSSIDLGPSVDENPKASDVAAGCALAEEAGQSSLPS